MAGYIFGGETGETQESLKRKRAMAEAMMNSNIYPRDAWSGLANAGEKIAGALIGRGVDRQDKAMQARDAQDMASLLATTNAGVSGYKNPDTGGMMTQPVKPGIDAMAASLASLNNPRLAEKFGPVLLSQQLGNQQWQNRFDQQNTAQNERWQMQNEAQDRRFQQQLAQARELAQMTRDTALEKAKLSAGSQGKFYAVPSGDGYFLVNKGTGMAVRMGMDPNGNPVQIGQPFQPAFNATSGQPTAMGVPATDANGNPVEAPNLNMDARPVMPPSIDPRAQGDVASAKEIGKAKGKVQGTAEANMPSTIQDRNQMLQIIDSIESDPQLPNALGMVDSRLPDITGYNTSIRSKIAQLKGNAFLQAYKTLKGGGQITEVEGQKATEAQMRINEAQTPEEFKAALQEARDLINRNFNVQKQEAGQAVPNVGEELDIGGVKVKRLQ